MNFVSCNVCGCQLLIFEVTGAKMVLVSYTLMSCKNCNSRNSVLRVKKCESGLYKDSMRLFFGMSCTGKSDLACSPQLTNSVAATSTLMKLEPV